MKRFSQSDIDKLLSLLFQWFTKNERSLPWRTNYSAYEVWISEMMLQQTQMERGVSYFLRWIEKFPSVEEVAKASESEILQAWEGLGYYSRARNLHKAAKIICEKHNGEIPCDASALKELAGIGSYTLAAIMGIAFEKDFATVDANVERVFSRLCNIKIKNTFYDEKTKKQKEISQKEYITLYAQELLPKGKARIYNQSLMEFGALVCKKKPQCELCPINKFCESYKLGIVHLRPEPKKKAKDIAVFASFAIIEHETKGFLVRKRPNKGLWANMWEFIGVDSFLLEKLPKEKSDTIHISRSAHSVLSIELERLFSLKIKENRKFPSSPFTLIKHSYTNHRLSASFFYWKINFDLVAFEDFTRYTWVKDLKQIAMPAHHRKALEQFFL